jgi:hypothetical protein
MEVIKFKATQEPIKALYGRDAKAAFLTLKARGSASDSTVTCKVETGRGLALAGIHPKAGGTGRELCSGDMLLEALIACAGVSMRAAAAAAGLADEPGQTWRGSPGGAPGPML